jgi:flagellar biosynthetic protein FliP
VYGLHSHAEKNTATTDLPASSAPSADRYTANFIRHFFEMLVAMVVGMMALGGLVTLALTVSGQRDLLDNVPLRAALMATYMSVGMGALMLYRRHAWPRIWEMSAAMFAPFGILLVPFATGLIGGGPLLAGGHLLMLPLMLGVMLWRREEYSRHHGHHS